MFQSFVCAFVCALISGAHVVQAVTNVSATPLGIPPSEYWDGDDGWWSTFQIQIGSPGQTLRLLPGTSASAGDTTWVVLPQGCTEANPSLGPDCVGDRGYVFTPNKSSTWSTQRLANGGLFELNTFEEGKLGLTGNAYYGFDTLNLGLPGSNLPKLQNQLIAGLATNDFWLGSLGLSPIPFNFTNLDDPIQSLLSNLRNNGTIPSISWGYTAGAHYQSTPVFGSLTLGGYDTTRFDKSKTLSDVAFGADFSRDLLVDLQSITFDTVGSSPLLAETIQVFIDSMVTQLWLPVDVCSAFEKAFGLIWNSTAELYLVNETNHNALLLQNPTFTFSLGGGASGETVNIVLPYSAFDLNVTQPIVSNETRYFPLKQGQNSSQYTLGRVFLQEAYVIADYDRQNFSVSQALFPSTSVTQDLVGILPPGFEVQHQIQNNSSALSGGAIAGIVVGAVVLLSLVIAGVIWLLRRNRRRKQDTRTSSSPPGSDEKKNAAEAELSPLAQKAEMDARESGRYEMDPANEHRPELSGDGNSLERYKQLKALHEIGGAESHEMGTDQVAAAELEAPMK